MAHGGRRNADDLLAAELAAGKSVRDAAALDYVRISLTRVQCHKYMRQAAAKKKP